MIIRFLLLALFVYLFYRLLDRLFAMFKQEKRNTRQAKAARQKKERWVDKSRAEDAEFEEIKDK
jgi:hypothetical protein